MYPDADVHEHDAVGREEQNKLLNRMRQDLSSCSGSDSNSVLIAVAVGLTAPPRQPPPPSCFTQRQLSPVIDEEPKEEEEHYLYDGRDEAEGVDGVLSNTPPSETETELVEWPHRGAQAQTAFQCIGVDYAQTAAADAATAGAASSLSPEAGQTAHDSEQRAHDLCNQVYRQMIREELKCHSQ